jgi:hypothetical protein
MSGASLHCPSVIRALNLRVQRDSSAIQISEEIQTVLDNRRSTASVTTLCCLGLFPVRGIEWTGLPQARSDGLSLYAASTTQCARKIQDAIRQGDGVISISQFTPNRRGQGRLPSACNKYQPKGWRSSNCDTGGGRAACPSPEESSLIGDLRNRCLPDLYSRWIGLSPARPVAKRIHIRGLDKLQRGDVLGAKTSTPASQLEHERENSWLSRRLISRQSISR